MHILTDLESLDGESVVVGVSKSVDALRKHVMQSGGRYTERDFDGDIYFYSEGPGRHPYLCYTITEVEVFE